MDTNVLIDFRQQDGKTPEVPVTDGYLLWTPLRREIYDTYITVPEPFTVYLTNGVGTAVIKNSWPYWRVAEKGIHSGITHTLYVPNVPEIHYSELPDVDPATLEPSPEALAGWTAALDEVRNLRDDAVAAVGLIEPITELAEQALASAVDIDYDPVIGWIITRGA